MLNDMFPNRCSAERHYPESSFSRTYLLRIVVQPNVVFPKHHLPKHSIGCPRILLFNLFVDERLSNICVIEFEFRHVWTWTRWEFVKFTQKKNGSFKKIVWLMVFGWFHRTFLLSRPNSCSVNETRLLKSTKVFAWIVFLTPPNILLIEPNVLGKYIK